MTKVLSIADMNHACRPSLIALRFMPHPCTMLQVTYTERLYRMLFCLSCSVVSVNTLYTIYTDIHLHTYIAAIGSFFLGFLISGERDATRLDRVMDVFGLDRGQPTM